MALHEGGGIRGRIKKVVPSSVLQPLLPSWHRLRGNAVAARSGYPGRKLKVIGVTGTNGKTTSCAYIDSILRAAGLKVGAYTTVYTRIGDQEEPIKEHIYTISPKLVHAMHRRAQEAKVDYFVQEVTSHALDQRRLVGFKYQATLFTNLTYEHMEYHKTMQHYAESKGLLFRNKPNIIAVNIDDDWGRRYFSKFPSGRRKFLFGTGEDANARLTKIKLTSKGGSANLEIDFKVIRIETKIIGEYNIMNAAGAACICLGLGIPIDAIERGIRNLTYVPGRMNSVDMGQGFGIFADYAHTPDGIEKALDSLKKVTKGKVIIVQSVYDGRDPNKWELLGDASAKYADLIIVTDEEALSRPRSEMRTAIINGAKKRNPKAQILEIADRETAVREAIARAQPGDNVLLVPQGVFSEREFYGFTTVGSDIDYARVALKTR